jgi:hypothetical protein
MRWQDIPAPQPGRVIFMASDGSLHSVPLEYLADCFEIDPALTVLARSPLEWRAFVRELTEVETAWSKRKAFTVEDREWLSAIRVGWEEPQMRRRGG